MKLLLSTILLITVLSVKPCHGQQAQTMRDVFSQMPDSLLPYLSHNNILDLIDFIESGMNSEITNSFDEQTKLLTLTADYLRLQQSGTSYIEMKLLPATESLPDSTSTIVCVVSTFGEHPKASTVKFYTSRWYPIDIASPITADRERNLIMRPDTMSDEHFTSLKQALYPIVVYASLSETEPVIYLEASTQTMSVDNENKEDIKNILRQISLKWDGRIFKEN